MNYEQLGKIVRAWCNVKEFTTKLAIDYPFIDCFAPNLEINSDGPDISVWVEGKRLKPEDDIALEMVYPIVESAAYAIGEIIPVDLDEALKVADFKLDASPNWRGPLVESIKRLADLLKTGENWEPKKLKGEAA